MIRIGIVGAENSHTAAIAQTINVAKRIRGFSVECVWGESEELANKAASQGCIPKIVKNADEMCGLVDAIVVDHRHPKFHLEAALPFIKKGIPVFIDKPFCYRVAEGREFLRIAKRKNAPVTSFSVLPLQKQFKTLLQRIRIIGGIKAAVTYGPCDLNSLWGGIFFYGIHQVDMVLKAFGYGVTHAIVLQNGDNAAAQLIYKNGILVTMNLIKEGCPGFAVTAVGTKGGFHHPVLFDENMYLAGIRRFTTMFKTLKQPESEEAMLAPIAILEALEKSITSKDTEKVCIC